MNMPIFHLGLLKNYQVVNVPGVYMVTVAATVTENNLIADDYPRYLVPLRVTTSKGLLEIGALMDRFEKVPFGMVQQHFLGGAIFENDGISPDILPVKGEKVLATFDQVDDKILCTHIELMPRTELEYVDVDKLCNFRNKLKSLIK